MADLSLKTTETLDNAENIEKTEQKVSAQENNPAGLLDTMPFLSCNAFDQVNWLVYNVFCGYMQAHRR